MATHSSQYSCLENPMDGAAWWATVNQVAHFHSLRLLPILSTCLAISITKLISESMQSLNPFSFKAGIIQRNSNSYM